MTANYLPVLLSSVNVNSCDDSDICDNQVSSQVDYLSHQWQEEDVWLSWRSMTRQKNEIANGIRLENASWRTWWKQRQGLQTVHPETLNWLKDSDVTWLYGPFHTSQAPPFASKTSFHSPQIRSSTPPPSPTCLPTPLPPKSILKHRTVSQLLVSALPTPNPKTDLVDVAIIGRNGAQTTLEQISFREPIGFESIRRPHLLHTRSETNMHIKSPFRRESPPRIIADVDTIISFEGKDLRSTDIALSLDDEAFGSSVTDRTPSIRKHISFNAFVEQRIAIEKPSSNQVQYATGSNAVVRRRDSIEYVAYTNGTSYPAHTWNIDEDDEGEDDNKSDDQTPYLSRYENSDDQTESGDEEDQPIEIKPRSRSSSAASVSPALAIPESSVHEDDKISLFTSGFPREHATIAPIAPTLLKTSANIYSPSPVVSSASLNIPRNRPLQAPHVDYPTVPVRILNDQESDQVTASEGDVPLLWVPPVGSGYEREFALPDPDEPGFGFAGGRSSAATGVEDGIGEPNWIPTPPSCDVAETQDDYFSYERQGRTQERQKGARRHRSFPSKVEESLSPVETASSSTTASSSSRSRSRSRNRDLLSPSPERNGHTSKKTSKSRSCSRSSARGSSASDESPARPCDNEGRGRTLVRNYSVGANSRSISRDRSRESPRVYEKLDVGSSWDDRSGPRSHAIRPAEDFPPNNSSLSVAEPQPPSWAFSVRQSDIDIGTSPDQSVPNNVGLSGKIAGIRGYIGGIWS